MARNKFNVDEELEAPFNLENLKKCGVYIGRYKVKMLSALALSAIGSIVGLIGPLIIGEATDVAIPNKDKDGLMFLAMLLIGTVLVSVGFNAIRTVIMAQVGQNIVRDIRKDLFVHLQKLPFAYYDSRPHGKILVRVVHYVNSVSDVLSNGILNVIIELINIIFIIVFMYIKSPSLATVIVAGLPIILAYIWIVKPRQRRIWQKVSNKNSNTTSFVQECIEGVKVTQTFDRQKSNEETLDDLLKERTGALLDAAYISNTVWSTTEIISQVVFTAVYIVGVYFIDPMVSFGTLLTMGIYSSRFWQPMINLANIYNNFINAIAYLERIFETMNEPPVIEDKENAHTLPPIRGEVEFKNVNFGYEPGQKILDDLSFKVNVGDSIAIVGPTGSGKTTIVNLISRFYNIDEGAVLIDGHSVMDVTLNSLRSQMGIMLQDSFIFSGTIKDNIRYGKLDATDSEIKKAAKLLQADAFINAMPRGYETVVNERGGGLSQGQKQLIAFARTLLSDPKILVLDEATSSIDTSTEKLLQEGIDLLLQGRTSFIIAHRLSTIKNCTKIMYIDKGKIVEAGSHDELLAKKGAYYDLYMAQFRK